MIESQAPVFIANDVMAEIIKAKTAKGKLVRVADEGYYEVSLTLNGRTHTAFLPIASTVLVAATPDDDFASIPVER